MTHHFAAATVVEPTKLEPGVGGHFTAEICEGWDIGGNANGGYLMAVAARAMAETVGRAPLTVTGHYLRPAPAGPCEIQTLVIRSGRRLATATATLSIGGKPTLTLLGSFGEQAPGGPSRQLDLPLALPAYDECVSAPSATADRCQRS